MITIVCLVGLACQEADWKRENFAGPVPEEIARGKNGRLELIGILGSRRWWHGDTVTCVAFSPDGKRALSGSRDTTLKLWEVESGKELATWKGHSNIVFSVAFSPDGKRALSGSNDTTLKLWEVESGGELDSIVVDGGPLDIAVHGNRALVGNMNGTVTVYRWK